ncbi:hypothetical protein [Kosakonia radicincitans]|uniref:hypothetical protein n=1 Tax=Kosakonia radicincitans TaxID=283686 RepID=UPI0031D08D6D
MKELNTVEMKEVSGAGFLADTAGMLGGGIGAIVDLALGSKNTAAADAGRNIGKGIGGIVEAGINAITSFFGSLFGKKSD